MDIQSYWPNWRSDIADTRRAIEGPTRRPTPDNDELLVLLSAASVILKGLYWLLDETQVAKEK